MDNLCRGYKYRNNHPCLTLLSLYLGLLVSGTDVMTGSLHSPPCEHRVYKTVVMADGKAEDGKTRLGLTTYKTEDGTVVQTVFGDFGSPSKAVQELERQVNAAAELINRNVERNKAGHTVGQRAEIVFPTTKPGRTVFAVVWTDGDTYHLIMSSCRFAALVLEKRLKEGPVPVR